MQAIIYLICFIIPFGHYVNLGINIKGFAGLGIKLVKSTISVISAPICMISIKQNVKIIKGFKASYIDINLFIESDKERCTLLPGAIDPKSSHRRSLSKINSLGYSYKYPYVYDHDSLDTLQQTCLVRLVRVIDSRLKLN